MTIEAAAALEVGNSSVSTTSSGADCSQYAQTHDEGQANLNLSLHLQVPQDSAGEDRQHHVRECRVSFLIVSFRVLESTALASRYAHTSSKVPISLLNFRIPALALNSRVPECFRRPTLREDEGYADDADDEKARDQKTETPDVHLHAFADNTQDEEDNGDLAEAGAHDVESLCGPVQLDGHDALVCVQVKDMSPGAIVDFRSYNADEDESEELRNIVRNLVSLRRTSLHHC